MTLLKFIILSVIIFILLSAPFRDPAPYGSKFLELIELIVIGAASCVIAGFLIVLWEVIIFV